VDAKCVKRIVLGDLGWKPKAVMAVGAINRPGSGEVDELVVLTRKDEGPEVYVSRHRPDGATLGPPRKIYVPFSTAVKWRLEFLPQSRVTVVNGWNETGVYFLEAEKPVNWIRPVEVGPAKGPKGEPQFLGVADAQAKPKAIMRLGSEVYAVDQDSTHYTASAGAFLPVQEPAPFYRIPDVEGFKPVARVFRSATRGDEFLVVRSREADAPQPSHREIEQAAQRFLKPEDVETERRQHLPSLVDPLSAQEALMAAEKKAKGITHDITTVEQWKRELPDSYRAWSEHCQEEMDGSLWTSLTYPLSAPEALKPRNYQEFDAYRSWLAGVAKPSYVLFELVRRGAKAREARITGLDQYTQFSDLRAPGVAWRDGAAGLSIVTALVPDDTKQPAYYEVRQGGGGH